MTGTFIAASGGGINNGGPGDDLTVSGTVQLNSGSYFGSFSPTYSGTATLVYNNGGTFGAGQEWGGNSGTAAYAVPFNVTIQNGTTVNMPTTDRGIGGSISVTNGTLAMNATSGNLFVGGNFTFGASGTFTSNGRGVTFNGSSSQSVSGASALTFDNLTVNNAGNVVFGSDATVNGTLTITAGQLQTGAHMVTLGGTGTLSEAGSGAIVEGNIKSTRTVGNTLETFGGIGVDLTATGTVPGVTTLTPLQVQFHRAESASNDTTISARQRVPA